MTIQRVCGLTLLLTAISLSGCSSLKGKTEATAPDSGATTPSDNATATGADTGTGIVVDDMASAGNGKARAKAAKAGLVDAQSVVHFAYDSDALSGADMELLKRHAAFLQANPEVQARLEGHTDERGTPEYNMALGERRAKAVAVFLQGLRVAPARLEVISYGELKPVADGEDESAWAQNRRVEIVYQ